VLPINHRLTAVRTPLILSCHMEFITPLADATDQLPRLFLLQRNFTTTVRANLCSSLEQFCAVRARSIPISKGRSNLIHAAANNRDVV